MIFDNLYQFSLNEVRVRVRVTANFLLNLVSVGFMTRMQVDLIDMRSSEYNGFKWIFHAKDHFSKYSWLFPMTSKEAVNVANLLQSIFYQFGPPEILQSNNGREFVAKVITNLAKTCPGLIIVNGRPRQLQSQGLVERGNSVVQHLIGKWLRESPPEDRRSWSPLNF